MYDKGPSHTYSFVLPGERAADTYPHKAHRRVLKTLFPNICPLGNEKPTRRHFHMDQASRREPKPNVEMFPTRLDRLVHVETMVSAVIVGMICYVERDGFECDQRARRISGISL